MYRHLSEELENQSNLKREKFWQNYEDFIEEFREKTHEMREELRRITKEQVKKRRKFQNEIKIC